MSSINLNSRWSSYMTLVSNIFIDEYMPDADGFYVKVYLYLLRSFCNVNKSVGICDIADKLETTERDVLRAICYWNKKGLITVTRDSSDNITDIVFENLLAGRKTNDSSANDSNAAVIQTRDTAVNTNNFVVQTGDTVIHNRDLVEENSYKKVSPITYNDIPDNINSLESSSESGFEYPDNTPLATLEDLACDDHFVEMNAIIEAMLERPINSIETNLIINLYTKYKFDANLIIHLFEYCLDNNKKESKLIEKIGMDWAINNIRSVDEAKEYCLQYSDVYYNVIKAFGINNRALGTNERKYIVKWTSQFGYGKDIIIEACNKTLTAIHTPSFEYADKIITGWYNSKVHNLDDIANINNERNAECKSIAGKHAVAGKTPTRAVKSSNFNFEQRDYTDKDFEDFEKRALAKYLNNN